ncbi:G-protein coupled receptor 151-like [Chelonia mydas]|uniref:G-protein coupled receptor 151-like n=1 Tax=Chelonia mydas TaxID=8469 RepID=UPI001CAA210D|nr:G-protein coupled receptor 151-like [Chelonia mydas]
MNSSQPVPWPGAGLDGTLALPLGLAALGLAGLAGNLLLLAVLGQELRRGRGSPPLAGLLHLCGADLLLLLLCAPLRLAAACRRAWPLGAPLCRGSGWLLHAALLAKCFALAAVGRARLQQLAGPAPGPHALPGRLEPGPDGPRCLFQPPPGAAGFMRVFDAAYPLLALLLPAAFTGGCYWRALRARGPPGQRPPPPGPATRLLLGLSLLFHAAWLPEWGLWLWGRLGGARLPPAALAGLAQAALFLPGALGPAVLLAACRSSGPGCGRWPDGERKLLGSRTGEPVRTRNAASWSPPSCTLQPAAACKASEHVAS